MMKFDMTNEEKIALQAYVSRWQKAAPILQAVRDQDIRESDTAQAMAIFTGSANWAILNRPASNTSGLVEQQAWFKKWRK